MTSDLPSPRPNRELRTWLANLIHNHAVLGEGAWEAADRIIESGRLVDRETINYEAATHALVLALFDQEPDAVMARATIDAAIRDTG